MPAWILKHAAAVTLALALGACNYLIGDDGVFRSRAGEYREARIVPEMRIPAELDSYTLDQLYVIPERVAAVDEDFERVPMPRPIGTRRQEGVVIQSLGDNRWIVIDATPAQVWPLVRDYWTELQIVLDFEDPGNGIMETSWVEVGDDREKRHKYRIVVEPGLHPGYSEIFVSHVENLRSDPIPVVVSWPENSHSPDLEQQILRSVSQYLADRNDIYQASSASLLAGSIEAASKANIVDNGGGETVLELRIAWDRAWVQVRQALEAASVVIVDTNREQSVFNVRFAGIVEEEDEPGFFGRLLGRGGNGGREPTEEMGFSVRLLETGPVIRVVTEALETSEQAQELAAELIQVINDNLG